MRRIWKNWQADERVNYADLEHSSIGDNSKGCGPCIINGQVVVNANCHCSSEELNRQREFVRRNSSRCRFRAVFTSSNILIPFFAIDLPRILDVEGDTVEWRGRNSGEIALIAACFPFRPAKSVETLLCPEYKTGSITIRNIEQLRRFLQALESRIIWGPSGERKIRELIERHERGEDISGDYEL